MRIGRLDILWWGVGGYRVWTALRDALNGYRRVAYRWWPRPSHHWYTLRPEPCFRSLLLGPLEIRLRSRAYVAPDSEEFQEIHRAGMSPGLRRAMRAVDDLRESVRGIEAEWVERMTPEQEDGDEDKGV